MINNIYPAESKTTEKAAEKRIKTRHDIETVAQTFDKEKIFLKKNGQEFNLDKFIQEQREDTEIYAVIEKYGGPETAAEILGQKRTPTYGDVSDAPKDLRQFINKCNEADEKLQEMSKLHQKMLDEKAAKIAEEAEKKITEPLKKVETEKENN